MSLLNQLNEEWASWNDDSKVIVTVGELKRLRRELQREEKLLFEIYRDYIAGKSIKDKLEQLLTKEGDINGS